MSTATIVVGLGFGDESKGATVARMASTGRVSSVIRFSGGAQAAHNVIAAGRHHTFRSFGSGTFFGVPTHLARPVMVDPWMLAAEVEKLEKAGVTHPLQRLTVDPRALVVTPIHMAVNRAREELRGRGAHGSCGLGVGEARWYQLAHAERLVAGDELGGIVCPGDATVPPLTVRACADRKTLRHRLHQLYRFYFPLLEATGRAVDTWDRLGMMTDTLCAFGEAVVTVDDARALQEAAAEGELVFEGSQGVLLDEWRGFHPHTTWSTVLPSAAQELLAAAGLEPARVVGVTRTYATRHGQGPLPTEDPELADRFTEHHNTSGTYQGPWRVGHLDMELLDYAARACRAHGGLDAVAVSHLDVVEDPGAAPVVSVGYRGCPDPYPLGKYRDLQHQQQLTEVAGTASPILQRFRPKDIPEIIAETTGSPVVSVSRGPGVADCTETFIDVKAGAL